MDIKVKVYPGNLYILDKYKVFRNFINNAPEGEYSFQKEFLALPDEPSPDPEQIKKLESCKVCFLEMTPLCDCAQKKWKGARLIGGLVIPVSLEKKVHKGEFIYRSHPFLIEGDKHRLLFNSFFITTTAFSNIQKLKLKYQLRIDILGAIQHWFSNHISRRGIIELV